MYTTLKSLLIGMVLFGSFSTMTACYSEYEVRPNHCQARWVPAHRGAWGRHHRGHWRCM